MIIKYQTSWQEPIMKTISIILATLVAISNGQSQSLVVKTNSGIVQGKTVTTHLGKEVDAFLGIPYAQPPLGELRFKHPLPVQSWEGIFNASEQPRTCFQKEFPLVKGNPQFEALGIVPTTDFSEDCLKLNIWVPKDRPKRAAVMVFIYGGGYSFGGIAIPMYDASTLSAEEYVIVVMMNYRVGSLGFLFLDHPDVPGNAGLYDQLLALKWIKVNIEAFGGDPDRITLFGQSSGAASVGQHLLSPLSSGLFNRAIMQSGSPTAEWATVKKKDALANSISLVQYLDCPHDRSNMTAIVRCLQAATPQDILANQVQKGYAYHFIYVPVQDGQIVPGMPAKSLREGHFANVSVMSGTLKNEGSIMLSMIDPISYPLNRDSLLISRQKMLELGEFMKFDKATILMLHYLYLGDVNPSLEVSPKYIDDMIRITTDYAFSCPVSDFEVQYSKVGNRVFKYYLPHHLSGAPTPKWVGSVHGEDVPLVFGAPFRGKSANFTKDEVILSRRMMRYWANFARTGDPNSSSYVVDDGAIYWPQYTPEGQEYLVLAPNSSAIGKAFREKFCIFWRDLRPRLTKMLTKIRSTENQQVTEEI